MSAPRSLTWLAVLASLLLTMAITAAAAADCALESGPVRAVTEVLDGDTLKLDDGSELRLAGIVAPRASDAASDTAFWPPALAARNDLAARVAGRSVEIAFSGPRADRYGRTVAHVFLVEGSRRSWLQGLLLAAGHARVFTGSDRTACADELIAHERIALSSDAGLWSNAAYQVRAAHETHALMRYRHTLQLVEGRVIDVAEVRGRAYLNFGTDWRSDFTAGIERPRSGGWPADLRSLKNAYVRVRGFIERRKGPYVELTHPSQLEMLQEPSTAAAASPSARQPPRQEGAGDSDAAGRAR